MKKHFLIVLLVLYVMCALQAQEEAPKNGFFDSFGLVFTMQNLLLDVDNYFDGYQAGAGGKYWLNKNWAIRGLMMVHHQSDASAGVNETWLGFSAIGEYHFMDRKLSPYIGPLAGTRLRFDNGNFIDLYFGMAVGGEMQLFKNLSAFAEYNLIAAIDDDGFGIDFGNGNNASLGIIMYFK